MDFVGIDIAKRAHVVGIRREDGTPYGKAWEFSNDEGGFHLLLRRLDELDIAASSCIVAMEATGHYWMALFSFLTDHGFKVAVINPSLVNGFRKADTMRKTKTDAIDCFLIANFARFKNLKPSKLDPEDAEGLKLLTRYRAELVEDKTKFKNRCTALLDRIFPELEKLFPNNLYGAAPVGLLKRFPTPKDIASADIRTITKVIREASRGYYGRDKAQEVKQAAKTSVGVTFSIDAISFELRKALEHIEFLEEQVQSVDEEIKQRLEATSGKWLLSIPGIGDTLASSIAAEIGDPFRFEGPGKLFAYAGIEPSQMQSGQFLGTEGKMTKRGSRYLRRSLMLAADKVRMYDSYFGDYYDSMISRGKHHYVALSGVARKLCAVILVLMKEEREYQKRPSVKT